LRDCWGSYRRQIDKMTKEAKYENCWEFWHCKKDFQDRCPVYKDKAGNRCWMYTDNLNVFEWIKPDRRFDKCSDCPWYKHINSAK